MKILHPRVLVTGLHLSLLILCGYFVECFQIPENFIFWLFWWFLFRLASLISLFLYFVASVKDPGYISTYVESYTSSETAFKDAYHRKQTSSLASHMTAVSAHRLDFKANPSTNTSAFIQLSHRISAPISPYGTETANVSQNSIQVESLNSDRLQVSLSDNNSVIIDIDELPEEEIVTFKSSPEQLDLERPSMSLKNEEECEEIFVVSQPVGDAECPSFPGTESEVQESMTRYCTACHIDQPIRAKHCSECKRCVATFDHHCPFLGTCIGEKNRLVFYWYLFFQASECWIGSIATLASISTSNWHDSAIKLIILGIIGLVLAILISILWSYHSYLAIANLTTWETKSWNKITYLNGFEKSKGSPFSWGIRGNLEYFCRMHDTLTKWAFLKVES